MPRVKCFGIHAEKGAGCVRVFWFPLVGWAFSTAQGVWWIGTGRLRAMLKAPWNEPLFSERYGHRKHIQLGGGWRVRFFRVPRNLCSPAS